ncbi:MAG: hypothetical protein RBT71_12070, partial [Flavobacteriales bacterium]|nr:hypothetical protein [Flavobacteriales bacterium]
MGALLLPALLSHQAAAQIQVSNIDIDLVEGATQGQLEVKMRFNDASFGEVFSGLVFTIRWPETSPALLPVGTPFCTGAGFPISASAHIVDGGFRYRTWNMEATAQLQADPDLDGGCGFVFPQDQWVTVLTINPIGNTECTEFQIINDAFTGANNRDYYVSLNGEPNNGQGGTLVGTIEPTPAEVGTCDLDCAGVPGGTAFIDNCGDCVGGTTGEVACVQDCNGEWGGSAFIDNCGDCVGGATGEVACVQDCNGEWGGSAFLDNCGDCVGGTTGEV